MASLYEIDQRIQQCVDAETGEVLDLDLLQSLLMDREQKLENVACWIKNLKAELTAIKAEEEIFKERKQKITNKIEKLEQYLIEATEGQKFSTGRCVVSFIKSSPVSIPDESLVPKKYLRKKVTYSPDRVAITKALKEGIKVKGCELLQKLNVQIK